MPLNRPLLATLALTSVLVLAGCQTSSTAERRLERRFRGMTYPIDVWGTRESRGPDKLAAAADWIAMDLERTAGQLERDVQWLGEWQRREFERWQARQPLYLKKTGTILWGRPENIEETAIKLFF